MANRANQRATRNSAVNKPFVSAGVISNFTVSGQTAANTPVVTPKPVPSPVPNPVPVAAPTNVSIFF